MRGGGTLPRENHPLPLYYDACGTAIECDLELRSHPPPCFEISKCFSMFSHTLVIIKFKNCFQIVLFCYFNRSSSRRLRTYNQSGHFKSTIFNRFDVDVNAMVIKTVWRSMVIKKHEAFWHPPSRFSVMAPPAALLRKTLHLHNIIIFINDVYFSTAVVYRQKCTNALYRIPLCWYTGYLYRHRIYVVLSLPVSFIISMYTIHLRFANVLVSRRHDITHAAPSHPLYYIKVEKPRSIELGEWRRSSLLRRVR